MMAIIKYNELLNGYTKKLIEVNNIQKRVIESNAIANTELIQALHLIQQCEAMLKECILVGDKMAKGEIRYDEEYKGAF